MKVENGLKWKLGLIRYVLLFIVYLAPLSIFVVIAYPKNLGVYVFSLMFVAWTFVVTVFLAEAILGEPTK